MSSTEDLEEQIFALKRTIDKQAEKQDAIVSALDALTEMLGHAITAMHDLTAALANKKRG